MAFLVKRQYWLTSISADGIAFKSDEQYNHRSNCEFFEMDIGIERAKNCNNTEYLFFILNVSTMKKELCKRRQR